jgi:hypothetical protein
MKDIWEWEREVCKWEGLKIKQVTNLAGYLLLIIMIFR